MDALSDHLTEERKRSRELQWAVEKEKCQTGRKEESKREELEVRAFRQESFGEVSFSRFSLSFFKLYKSF